MEKMDEDELNKKYLVKTISEDEYNDIIQKRGNFYKLKSVYKNNKNLCGSEFLVYLKFSKIYMIENKDKSVPSFMIKSKIEVTEQTNPEMFI